MFSVITFNRARRPHVKTLLFAFLLALASGFAGAQDNCAINPGACQARPVPSDCKPGHHWTLIGSGIAHCVADDPPCAGGKVNHDALGNPTNCQTSASGTTSCGAGFTGLVYRKRAVYKWMDGSVTYGGWQTTSDTCKEIPPPEPEPEPTPAPGDGGGGGTGTTPPPGSGGTATCTPSDVVVSQSQCPAGTTGGPIVVHATNTCPGNMVGSYTTGTCGGDTCTPSEVLVNESACPAGQVGGPLRTYQKITCPGNAVQTHTTGKCEPGVCSNGALNFPGCNKFPGCPYAGEVARTFCYTRAEYNGGGGDCIEPTMFWGKAYYQNDPECTAEDRIEGSTGTYEGYCPGRTPAVCPPGY